ncbi:MAG TPA: hypothetical protein VJ851_00130 [Jatrophihabitans sp.]|nr:hypothetical protein [Jatrophihabitans sp.]
MATTRRRTGGLTDEDVQRLRDQLADGRRPRVRVSGPQFDGGTSATVVRIGDPAIDGTDYLTVRVKVNGVLDELAFAPAELSVGRAQPAGRQPRRVSKPAKATRTVQTPDVPAPEEPPPAEPPPAERAPAKAAPATTRRRKSAPVPQVSFTVASSGASWAVSASRGSKGIVRQVAVPPGVVTALVELLDQPALLDAVAEINETARAEAQARAEELRAELSRLEAVLATHRTPSDHRR